MIISLSLPNELVDACREYVKVRGMTVSGFIRVLIEERLRLAEQEANSNV